MAAARGFINLTPGQAAEARTKKSERKHHRLPALTETSKVALSELSLSPAELEQVKGIYLTNKGEAPLNLAYAPLNSEDQMAAAAYLAGQRLDFDSRSLLSSRWRVRISRWGGGNKKAGGTHRVLYQWCVTERWCVCACSMFTC